MKVIICSAGLMLASPFGGLAQTPAVPPNLPTAPVPARRVPAPQTSAQQGTKEPALVQKYDFGSQLRVLQDPTAMDGRKSGDPLPGVPSAAGGPEIDAKSPKGFQPPTDVPLNPTAQEAVRVSESWRGAHNTPAAGADGRVLYAYGGGLPIVVCAPCGSALSSCRPGSELPANHRSGIRCAGMCRRQCTGRGKAPRQSSC
jgi:type IV secretion system protein VirB9